MSILEMVLVLVLVDNNDNNDKRRRMMMMMIHNEDRNAHDCRLAITVQQVK